jgi:hypothetical protein
MVSKMFQFAKQRDLMLLCGKQPEIWIFSNVIWTRNNISSGKYVLYNCMHILTNSNVREKINRNRSKDTAYTFSYITHLKYVTLETKSIAVR